LPLKSNEPRNYLTSRAGQGLSSAGLNMGNSAIPVKLLWNMFENPVALWASCTGKLSGASQTTGHPSKGAVHIAGT